MSKGGITSRCLFPLVVVVLVVVIGSCATVPELDLTTLDDRSFELSEIMVMVKEADDPDWKGHKFLNHQLYGILKAVNTLFESNKIVLKSQPFLDVFNAGKIEFKKDNVSISKDFVVHQYIWKLDSGSVQACSISIPLCYK